MGRNWAIQRVAWDDAKNLLSARSDAPPKEPYTVWIHVPVGFRAKRVIARAGMTALEVTHNLAGQSLMVRFPGQREPVDWQVEFSRPVH